MEPTERDRSGGLEQSEIAEPQTMTMMDPQGMLMQVPLHNSHMQMQHGLHHNLGLTHHPVHVQMHMQGLPGIQNISNMHLPPHMHGQGLLGSMSNVPIPTASQLSNKGRGKKCVQCHEVIAAASATCPKCQYVYRITKSVAAPPKPSSGQRGKKPCRKCKAVVPAASASCKECGYVFRVTIQNVGGRQIEDDDDFDDDDEDDESYEPDEMEDEYEEVEDEEEEEEY